MTLDVLCRTFSLYTCSLSASVFYICYLMVNKHIHRGSDGTGCFRIEVRTDTAELSDMRVAGLRKCDEI